MHLAAHLFQPERLKLARELRGYTKAELAALVGKSPAAISQFEGTGRVACRPEPGTLATIALALGLPLAFFSRPASQYLLELEQCHFRSLRSASQRDRRKLVAQGAILSELARHLEEHVELPVERVSSLARTVRDPEEIERAAADVRRALGLGLGPIPNVVRLLETAGVLVVEIGDGSAEVDAFSAWSDGRPIVYLVQEKGSASRSRFDAAHELGHLVMHTDVSAGDPELERQANRFASAFLLPRETFLRECPRWLNWDHFYELKRRWKVSVQGLLRRAYDLNVLSEASYRRAFVHLNKIGERRHERDEPEHEHPTLLQRALSELAPDFSVEDIAFHVSLSAKDIRYLLRLP